MDQFPLIASAGMAFTHTCFVPGVVRTANSFLCISKWSHFSSSYDFTPDSLRASVLQSQPLHLSEASRCFIPIDVLSSQEVTRRAISFPGFLSALSWLSHGPDPSSPLVPPLRTRCLPHLLEKCQRARLTVSPLQHPVTRSFSPPPPPHPPPHHFRHSEIEPSMKRKCPCTSPAIFPSATVHLRLFRFCPPPPRSETHMNFLPPAR